MPTMKALVRVRARLVTAAMVLTSTVALARCGVPSQQQQSDETGPTRYRHAPTLDDGCQAASPEELGLRRAPLERMTDELRRGEYPNVHAVLIAKDGRLVYEEYFAGQDRRDRAWPLGPHQETVPIMLHRDSLHDTRSAAKSIAAALVGIAVGSGAIRSLDTSLFDYFPEHAALATP